MGLSAEEKATLEAQMEEKLQKLDKKIEELEELCKPVSPDNAIGRLSRMDAINNRAVNERTLNSNKNKANKLRKALEKLDDPDFGICIICKKPISVGRLTAMPESDKCVNCANR